MLEVEYEQKIEALLQGKAFKRGYNSDVNKIWAEKLTGFKEQEQKTSLCNKGIFT